MASLTVLTNPGPSVRYVNLSNSSPASPYLDWSTAATNIQDAIDASVDGDVVLVTNGTYSSGSRIVYPGTPNRVVVTRAITVQSVNGPDVTLIQGARTGTITNGFNSVRCVYLTNNATLIGFTLTNGSTKPPSFPFLEQDGGGIWCEPTNVVVSNCVFSGNSSWTQGGGAYRGTLINCIITNNSAAIGGGENLPPF